MIKKILIKYTVILLLNLLVFLWVWFILDYFLETDWKVIIFSLILSVFSLVIITQNMVMKNLKKLNNIKTTKENGANK